jgi:hypothetical protein
VSHHRKHNAYHHQISHGVKMDLCFVLVLNRTATIAAYPTVKMVVINLMQVFKTMRCKKMAHHPNLEIGHGDFFTSSAYTSNAGMTPPNKNTYGTSPKEATVLKKNMFTDAQAAIKTAIYVYHSENARFHSLLQKNDYLSGIPLNPSTLEQAVNLLTYNQDFGTKVGRSEQDALESAASFVQKHKKAGKGNKKKQTDDDKESDGTPPSPPRRTNSRSTGWSS